MGDEDESGVCMRLPGWLTVAVSVGLLLGAGAVGWQMNESALHAAESVQRTNSAALAGNNTALASEYLMFSAKELDDFAQGHAGELLAGRQGETQRLLAGFTARSVFFRRGAALTDLSGRPLAAHPRPADLPPPTDPGYQPLRAGLRAGGAGFSGVLTAGPKRMTAVAVPVVADGTPRALLMGYAELTSSQLQAFVGKLESSSTHGIVDSTGRLTAVSDPALLGRLVPDQVRGPVRAATATPVFVEYRAGGRDMIAIVAGGAAGGWGYYRSLPVDDFYGAARSGSMRINLALLGMILVAAAGLMVVTRRGMKARRRAEEHFRALVQNAADCITVLDPTGRIVYDSPSISALLGFPPGHRIGSLGGDTLHPEDRAEARAMFARLLTRPGAVERMQCRALRHDGGHQWVDMSVTNLVDNPAIRGLVVNARDVSDSRRLQEQLAYQARHDSLTGLPNRRLLNERLGEALDRMCQVAVLFVDLDRFKTVNDSLGHDAGDELLRQVGARLAGCLRVPDLLARVGGDEFVALLDGIAHRNEAIAVADRIVAVLRAPFDVFGESVTIGASVGVCFDSPGATVDDMLGGADAAMYQVKQSGGLAYALVDA
jgi:diguanylate cyclase (GGDEF)-like protein/PAS domain S-box-containing protein